MARGLLVSRDRNTPVAAPDAALRRRRGPPPVRLGRATAECGRHVACSSHRAGGGIRCCSAALPSASLAGESYCGARTAHGMLVQRDRNEPGTAGGGTRCCSAARTLPSVAGEIGCRARTARAVRVLRDRDAPVAELSSAWRRCPHGRATAVRGWHVTCSSCVIAAAARWWRHPMLPCGAAAALCHIGWGKRLQSADGTWRARLARSQHACIGT